MRELSTNELSAVSGGIRPELIAAGIGLAIPSGLGLIASIPLIVAGAVLALPTLGLSFIPMTAGIIGTAFAGAGMITSIVLAAVGLGGKTTVLPP